MPTSTPHSGGVGAFISKYVFSKDHKIIGLQFLFFDVAVVFGGRIAGLGHSRPTRMALGRDAGYWPDAFSGEGGQISPEFYTTLFTMHATVMIFFVIIPILAGAFGNYLIPLMIGADDMAFPTLNMLSYWFMWPAFVLIGMSFFFPPYGSRWRLDFLSTIIGRLGSRSR